MFSNQLQQEAQPIMEGIYEHPFVQDIERGHVKPPALKFYVEQDYQYVLGLIKVYARIIASSDDTALTKYFNGFIDFLLNGNLIEHKIFSKLAGVQYDELKHAIPTPKAALYIDNMNAACDTGSMLNMLAAVLPDCWTYGKLAEHLVKVGAMNQANPFYSWIRAIYMPFSQNISCMEMSNTIFKWLNQFAENKSQLELKTASQFFLKSCEAEWQFWQQAYRQEDWHFKAVLDQAAKNY